MKNYLTEVLVILADAGVEFVVGGGVALRSAENWNGCKKLNAVAASANRNRMTTIANRARSE